MSIRVPSELIEGIVGHERHARIHYGRAVSSEQTMYILHSQNCLEHWEKTPNSDLRDCVFSVALDNGLDMNLWADKQDQAVPLSIVDGRLWPGIIAGHELKAGLDFE
jgi:hypothetical protein